MDKAKTVTTSEMTSWEMYRLYTKHNKYGSGYTPSAAESGLKTINQNVQTPLAHGALRVNGNNQ